MMEQNRAVSTVSASGDTPQLPTVDLGISSNQRARSKTFELKVKGEVLVQTMTFRHETYRRIFQDICTKCGCIADAADVKVHYPVRNASGPPTIRTVVNDIFLSDQLKTFFLECETHSKIIVELPPSSSRDKHANEVLYDYITTLNFTVDRRFYEFLQEYPEYCDKFLVKRRYLNLIIGRDYHNWLNPAYYICHLKECMALVKIGSFCNISKIILHIKTHSKNGNSCCKTIMRRHHYLLGVPSDEGTGGRRKIKKSWIYIDDFDAELSRLEDIDINGQSSKADLRNKFFVEEHTQFRGAHLRVNIDVLKNIAKGDSNALTSIPALEENSAGGRSQSSSRSQSFYAKNALAALPQAKRKTSKSKQKHSSSSQGSATSKSPSAGGSAAVKPPSAGGSGAAKSTQRSAATKSPAGGSIVAKPPSAGGSVAAKPPSAGGSVAAKPPSAGGSVAAKPPSAGGSGADKSTQRSATKSPTGGSVVAKPPSAGGSVAAKPPSAGGSGAYKSSTQRSAATKSPSGGSAAAKSVDKQCSNTPTSKKTRGGKQSAEESNSDNSESDSGGTDVKTSESGTDEESEDEESSASDSVLSESPKKKKKVARVSSDSGEE